MIVLLLSITLSSTLFVFFKLFERFKIDNLTAIIVNYAVAYLVGCSLEGSLIVFEAWGHMWFWGAILLGGLFLYLFKLIARITQEQGVAVSVLANKMSLIIPVGLAVLFLGEELNWFKITGILLACLGIVFTVFKPNLKGSLSHLSLPLVLFVGSGLLDFILKINQQVILGDVSYYSFVAVTFLGAFLFGVVYATLVSKWKLGSRNLLAGLALGIPNYFSIYFVMLALNLPGLQSNFVFPINNSGILLLSTLFGFWFFKEKLTALNWAGIGLCLAAIFVIAQS